MGCLATEGTRYAGGICLGLEGAWGLRPERFLWGKLRVHAVRACMLTHVQLCATPWTIWPARLLCPWNSPGKNTGVGCHSLLQGTFPTQGSKSSLLIAGRFFTAEPSGKPHTGVTQEALMSTRSMTKSPL